MFKILVEIFKELWFDTPIYFLPISYIGFFVAKGFIYIFKCFYDSYLDRSSCTEVIECTEMLSSVSEQLNTLTVQESVPAPVSVDVKIIPKYVRCRYCDSMFESGTLVCVNCGGNLEQLEV